MTLVVIAASVDVAVAADGAAAFVDQRKKLTLDVSAAAAAAKRKEGSLQIMLSTQPCAPDKVLNT